MIKAPVLEHNGEKKKAGTNEQFYLLPQGLMDIVFSSLGNASAQLRVMIVLLGTKPGFAVSEEWILDRTGLKERSYIEARKALVNRGWITHTAFKNIVVNIDAIYAEKPETTAGKKKPETKAGKENKPEMTAGKEPDTSAGQPPETTPDIIDNGIDKNKNKAITAPQAQLSQIKEVSKQKYEELIFGGFNQVEWIDKAKGIFRFNGKAFRVRDWQQTETPGENATMNEPARPAEKGALNRPETALSAKGGQFVF